MRSVLKLYVVGLQLVAGFGPLQAQSTASDLQIPMVDRLPKWYYEQGPNQAIGISLSALKEASEEEYEQAICFALIRAALSQADTNVVSGQLISARESSANMWYDALTIFAFLKIPIHYIVLDQCRLKDGPVLGLLQYQYRNLAATEALEFTYECRISNDSAKEAFAIENKGQYRIYGQSEYLEGDFFWLFTQERVEPFMYASIAVPLNIRQYNHVLRNEYLLRNPKMQEYIGALYFDDLRRDLYRKLMYLHYDFPSVKSTSGSVN